LNTANPPDQMHLKQVDLNGIAASLRSIFTIADDGKFDSLLRDLDGAFDAPGGNIDCPGQSPRGGWR
jgi:hypothetical protein